jgi:hypothetical protein
MTFTPRVAVDTIGTAGRLLITPHTDENEIRDWLDAAYGSPAELHTKLDQETATAMVNALDKATRVLTCEHPERLEASDYDFEAYLGLNVEYLEDWDSDAFNWRPSGNLGREITATAPDGAEIRFSADVEGDEIIAHFRVELPEKELGRKHFATASTADWPVIERYVPRDEWPTCMWAGQHGPNQRHPAPEVQAVVDKAVNDRAAAFAESYRIILEWRHSEHLRNDWLHPNTVFIVEEWTVYVWKVVEAGHDEKDFESYVEPPEWLADLSDGFQVDPQDEDAPDTTDFKPYDDAEKRLLRKAGLDRSIVLRVGGPW